jgi:chemotaxis protein histidine kinase CheA
MPKQSQLSPEIDELRKSLEALNMDEAEIDLLIEKAIKKGEDSKQPTVEEMAAKGKKEGESTKEEVAEEKAENKDAKPEDESEDEKEFKKSRDEFKKGCQKKMDDDLADFDAKRTSKPAKKEDETIQKSMNEDILKSIESKFDNRIDNVNSTVEQLSEIVKSLSTELNKYLNEPLGTKSIQGNYKVVPRNAAPEGNSIELSLRENKQEILKSLEDCFNTESNEIVKSLLGEDIKNYSISNDISLPTVKYLISKNITIKS